jgi:hypothetical protein
MNSYIWIIFSSIVHKGYFHGHNSHDRAPSTNTLGAGVLNGRIPSAVSNTGATSHALLLLAPSIPTGNRSKVIFHLPNGTTAAASTVNKLLHNALKPTQSANNVPTLANNSLMSTSKFVDSWYTIVYYEKEVNY